MSSFIKCIMTLSIIGFFLLAALYDQGILHTDYHDRQGISDQYQID